MAFNGSLLSMCQPSTVGTNNEVYDNFSLDYIFRESYKVTPNRRQDLDSGRNTDGVMQRNVLPHYVSTISFDVKSLYNNQLAELMSAIRSHYTIEKEKKISELEVRIICITEYVLQEANTWVAQWLRLHLPSRRHGFHP